MSRVNREDIIRLLDMSLEDKLLEAFHLFPNNISFLERLIEDVQQELAYFKCSRHLSLDHNLDRNLGPLNMTLGMYGFGEFGKSYDPTEDQKYSCFFRTYDSETRFDSETETQEEVEELIDNVIPFFLSDGENLERVPLIINTFPELARFLLKWNGDLGDGDFYDDEEDT